MRDDIPTANAFAYQIEEMVWDRDIPYTDAVLIWCERRGLEPEIAAGLVKKSAPLKAKIELEAEEARLIRSDRGNTLPV